ncbi:hypothetical protein C2E20_8257 [Micractinium conductrix]|uniref:Uncharacterized protein n=1 Tax=Micractinium conductrix TaxID=554055 RepID=A0A2P6V1Z1_9CHLO|nr:hypothetical protein C2E20_8257 [Micractinium conductrix]|eukprot:PSC68110.1 hypothetical protein C2E20_8257 [Micractinium conductrix]
MRSLSLLVLALAMCSGARAQAGVGEAIASAVLGAKGAVVSGLGGLMQNHLENAKITAQTMGQGLSTTATAMGQGLGAAADALSAAYATAGAQAEAALAAFEKEYCTPATFVPSEKVPATFTGHSMSLTFSLGECTFDDHKWLHEDVKELDCTEPSITYTKTPANFTSKFHSAPSFTSKECKIEKVFGEEVTQVLFVFDGSQAPDVATLTAKITEEVKKVLGTVGTGVQDMVGNTKSMLLGGLTGGFAAGNMAAATAGQAQALPSGLPAELLRGTSEDLFFSGLMHLDSVVDELSPGQLERLFQGSEGNELLGPQANNLHTFEALAAAGHALVQPAAHAAAAAAPPEVQDCFAAAPAATGSQRPANHAEMAAEAAAARSLLASLDGVCSPSVTTATTAAIGTAATPLAAEVPARPPALAPLAPLQAQLRAHAVHAAAALPMGRPFLYFDVATGRVMQATLPHALPHAAMAFSLVPVLGFVLRGVQRELERVAAADAEQALHEEALEDPAAT